MALSASPSSLTFENASSAPQTCAISGGVGPYSIATQPANANATIAGSTLTVAPTGAGGPDNVVVQDSTSGTPLTLNVAITVTNSALTLLPDALTFTTASSPAATVSISGGITPYSLATVPSSAIATVSLSGSTLTVTPVGPGSAECYIKDSEGSAQAEAISIVVGAATTLLWPDVRVTIFDAFASEVLCRDAVLAGDLGMDTLTYEDTPSGCGAGSLTVNLTLSEITARGYYRAYNIVEISTADMLLTTACAAGASKIYVDSNRPVNPAYGEDGQQLYLYDGATLTMLIPVTGVGSDSGGNYITIGTPVSTPGNPSTLPAYGAGTYVGRRRYCGRIVRRSRPNQKTPKSTMTLVGFGNTLSAYGTFTITNVDSGTAIYNCLAQFASRWSFLTISESNFPTIGWSYNGQQTQYSVLQMISDICATIPTGDLWVVRIGHDRTPRLIKVYDSATDSYPYNVTLPQAVTNFEPLSIQIDDEDASNLYNAVQVTASNTLANQSANVPPAAIVNDSTSIDTYGQVDAQPVTQTGLSTQTDCINYGISLLNQYSLAVSNNQFRVYTRNESAPANMPAGFANGDVVRGVDCVTLTRFDDTGTVRNAVPDSEFIYGPGQIDAFTWTTPSTAVSVALEGGEAQSNAIAVAGTGATQGVAVASLPIDVAPGQTLTLSLWINASACTSGQASAAILPSVNGAYYGSYIGSKAIQAYGNNSLVSVTITIPTNATYAQVQLVLQSASAVTPTGHSLLFSQPQLEPGSSATSYIANAAAPNVFGLVSSALTTIDPRGDRWQDVKFAAIEPDWNAAMAEKTRALANAILLNSPTPVSISSYCVSVEAYPSGGIPISGLTVTPPTFLAIFAQGDPVVTVAVTGFTLQPTATNWAWLNPSGAWTVNQNPETVAGAILYGYFQTSATGVLGYTETAPIGVVKIGVGNVNVASNLAAPTCTGITVANTSTPTTLSSDVEANLTVTNVPQDGSAYGLAYYFRTHGTSAWVPYGEITFPGLPSPATSIAMPAFVYGQMPNGVADDYAVGFVGLAGYGPLTTIASNITATPIVVTAPYMIGTTSPTPTVTSVTVSNGISANGIAAAVSLAFTVTNQPVDGSLAWLDVYFRTHGAADYTFYTRVAVPGQPTPSASQAYSVILADITTGQYLDFACKFANLQGAESTSYGVIYSNWEALTLNLPASALPTVPAGTTMTATGSVTGYAGAGGGGYYAQFTVTPVITSSLPFADWGVGFAILAKINNSNPPVLDGDTNPSDYHVVNQIATNTWSSGALAGVTSALGAGNSFQLAVAAIAQNGKYGPIVPFAIAQNQPIGSGSIGSLGAGNLIVDSDLDCTNYNASGVGTILAYWQTYLFDGISGLISKAQVGIDGAAPTANCIEVFDGFSGDHVQLLSEAIAVVPGTTYYFSYWMGTLSCSGSAPLWAIVATNYSTASHSGTVYQSLGATNGEAGQVYSTTWTCPTGVTQVSVLFDSNATTISSGGPFHSAAPFLSAQQGPYTPGPTTRQQVATSPPPSGSGASATGPANTNDLAGTNTHLAMSAGTQAVISSGGQVNVNPTGGVTGNLPQANHDPAVLQGSATGVTKNLVPDSDFRFGYGANKYWNTGGTFPSGVTAYMGASSRSGGGGNIFGIVNSNGSATAVTAWLDSVPVYLTNGVEYTLSCYIDASQVTSGSPKMAIFDTGITTSYESLLQAPLTLGRVSMTFTFTGTSGNYVILLDSSGCTIAASSTLVYSEPMLQVGSLMTAYEANLVDFSGALAYGAHAAAVTNTLDINGYAPKSTFLNKQASTLPFSSNMNVWLASATSATYIWMYITSGATGTTTAGTIYNPDGSSYAASGFSNEFTGLTSGATYYFGASFNVATATWSYAISAANIRLSATQVQALLEDGYAFFSSSFSLPAGSSGGGGGAGCPAVGQIIETRERGFIAAELLMAGEHVRHPDGSWRELTKVSPPMAAQTYRVTFDTEAVEVDASHLFERELGSGQWVNVRDLKRGDRFSSVRGRDELVVLNVERTNTGLFVPLGVDGMRYVLGATISHNIKMY